MKLSDLLVDVPTLTIRDSREFARISKIEEDDIADELVSYFEDNVASGVLLAGTNVRQCTNTIVRRDDTGILITFTVEYNISNCEKDAKSLEIRVSNRKDNFSKLRGFVRRIHSISDNYSKYCNNSQETSSVQLELLSGLNKVYALVERDLKCDAFYAMVKMKNGGQAARDFRANIVSMTPDMYHISKGFIYLNCNIVHQWLDNPTTKNPEVVTLSVKTDVPVTEANTKSGIRQLALQVIKKIFDYCNYQYEVSHIKQIYSEIFRITNQQK